MRAASAVTTIIVLVLWLIGATLIAAPSNVISMVIPSSLGLTSDEITFLGIMAFVVAAIIIVLYTYFNPDEVQGTPTPSKQQPQPSSTPPS